MLAGDVERGHAEQLSVGVEQEGARLAVDLDVTHRGSLTRYALRGPRVHGARDVDAPVHRACSHGDLPATVTAQHHIRGEQGLDPREVAFPNGGEEALRELVTLLPRC